MAVSYAFACGSVRARESGLLTAQERETLLALRTPEQLTAALRDRGWGDAAGLAEGEELLRQENARLTANKRGVTPDFSLYDAYLVRQDYHNLKATIKGVLSGRAYAHLLLEPATVSADLLREAVETRKFSLLPEGMAQAAEKAYDRLAHAADPQGCDSLLDRAAMAAQRQAAIFGNAVCNFRIQPNRTDCRRELPDFRDQVNRHRRACDIIRKGMENLRRAEISHKIIAGAARNTCHLCVFIGIRPRKYLVQSTVPAAGVKAHRFPVITVLPGDFSRVAGVLCQLHSIIHTRTGRRVDQPRHKIKAGVRFPGYRIHNKNMLHQGIPLSSHFIIIIPHLYQTYNCHSVQKSGR